MLFKRTALFFLTLAAVILLLHGIVPHTHEHLDVAKHTHSHHDHGSGDVHHDHDAGAPEDNHHDEKGELANVLSNINHHAEGITFITAHKFSIAVSKQFSAVDFLIPEAFCLNENPPPILLHFLPAEFFDGWSFLPCTDTLRGPPSIAV